MIENIKALIAKKGFTQKSIATEIGLSEKSLGNFLNGKSSLNSDALNRLLLFLGFDLDKEIGMSLTNKTSRIKTSPLLHSEISKSIRFTQKYLTRIEKHGNL